MNAERLPELGAKPEGCKYLYLKPENLLTWQEKEWLAQASIAHVSPLWLEKPRDTRLYGGAEDVVLNTIYGLAEFNLKGQELFGNPKDKVLEERLPNFHVHYPPFSEFRTLDLFEVLQTDPIKAKDLERQYVFFSYQELSRRLHWVTAVHDHTNYGKDQAYWLSQKVPVVRTEHGPIISPDNSAVDAAHFELFKNAKNLWFIAISENQYQQMPDLPWIAVVHNGIDPDDFEFSMEKKGNYLLYMGRICKTKAPDKAIKVAKALKIPLILAGHVEQTPESQAYYEAEIRPHIDDVNVQHIQGVAREERKRLYRDAKCLLVLGEWEEPFGLVSAEAAMSGTPVVGFNRGAIPEVVANGETGFVVDTLDGAIDRTAQVLQGAINPNVCRKKAEIHFSKPVMVAKLVKVYIEAKKRFNGESNETSLINFDNIGVDEGISESRP